MSESRIGNKIGRLGEDIACEYLENKGFLVIERNYRKKFGEIDIIAQKANILHFIEVKSVTRENLENISRVTDNYRPEDNIHPWKLKRLSRTVQSYLTENNIGEEGDWQFGAITVYLDQKNKKAKVDLPEPVSSVTSSSATHAVRRSPG